MEETNRFDVDDSTPLIIYKKAVINTITNTAFKDRTKAYCEYREDDNFFSGFLVSDMNRKHPELRIYFEALGLPRLKRHPTKKAS